MKVGVTGSSGLIGSSLRKGIESIGWEAVAIPRDYFDGSDRTTSSSKFDHSLDSVDAVVHLAGENIASGRWTDRRKSLIRDSRVNGTRRLSEVLVERITPPSVLVLASAIGFYGDRGNELLNESSKAGIGFLSDVCQIWEAAAEPARSAGIRVVHLRIGIVMAQTGGALRKMLMPFKLGIGGVIGSGSQYMSWISLDDVIGGVLHALHAKGLEGPVNLVSPNPVTNSDFTKTLGRVLRRPTIIPVPSFALRLVLGEMAEALLLASTRVEPSRLVDSGYSFKFPNLEDALSHTLEIPSSK